MSDRSLHTQQLPAGRRPVAPQRRRLPVAAAAAAAAALALLAATPGFAAAPGFATPGFAATGTQYALIVNGDDSFTHNYNVSLALASLRQLGYAPQNTLTLAPASLESSGAAVEAATWRRPATEQGLRQTLALLRERVRPGDLLLVYLTGHGYRMFGRTSLGLQDGSITAHDLMQQLGEIPFGKLVLIADQCYSGGFSNAAVALGRNVVAVSSTDDRHEVRCEPFIRPLWLAAVAAESDTRGNGFVSIEEAFQVALSSLARAGGAGSQGAAGSQGGAPRLAASGTCRPSRSAPWWCSTCTREPAPTARRSPPAPWSAGAGSGGSRAAWACSSWSSPTWRSAPCRRCWTGRLPRRPPGGSRQAPPNPA